MQEQLVKKLRYKSGKAVVLNAPDGYHLGIESETVRGIEDMEEKYDFVQWFVHDSQEVNEWLPKVIPSLHEDAVFWITYPKQSSKIKTDINRDTLRNLVTDLSPYTTVSNVAVDQTWSALRFRHQDKVKSKK